MTKTVLFVDKRVGFEICEYLFSIDEDIARIYVRNSGEDSKKIEKHFKNSTDIFVSDDLKDRNHIQELKQIQPDFMVTVYWPYLLKPEIFNSSKNGCINFHPALLPHNRGWYPHVHNILNNSEAGVTLHFIDENADTGPIVAQKKINVDPSDTAFTLYTKLQDERESSFHNKSDIIDHIDLDKKYSGKELINILRARTFGSKGFAYYKVGNKKIFLNLRLNYDGNF